MTATNSPLDNTPNGIFAVSDFTSALFALLPSGEIWKKISGSVLSTVCTAFAGVFVRVNQRSQDLINESPPVGNTTELLTEWEQTLSLPDSCGFNLGTTLQQRRQAVKAKLSLNPGSCSVPYYTNYLSAVGLTATITEYTSFQIGSSRIGQPLNDPSWCHAWQINMPLDTTPVFFSAGQSSAGDPLQSWGNPGVLCIIQKIKPAHTVVLASFS